MNLLYVGNNRQLLALSDLIILTELNLDQYKQVSIPQVFEDFESDYRFDYLCSQICSSLHEVVLIDLDWFSKNDYLGARLANHIRLTKWENISFKEVPIVILRNEPIDITKYDVIKDDLTIFSGKGAYFSTYSNLAFSEYDAFSDEDWFSNIFAITRRHKADFNYFNYLKLLRFSESYEDSHSITNQWGALRLAANAGYSSSDIGYESPPKLYFKYLQEKYQFDVAETKLKIKARVLLIDDNAEKGWEKVLKKIFNFNDKEPTFDNQGRPTFRTINEKVNNYESLHPNSRKIIEEQEFDLYFIDLRLNGSDENITTKTTSLSGAIVLQKIKSINAGNQVIIFTASNKAWNMRALLTGKNAADGYYIKESPLNAIDNDFGKSNTDSLIQQVNLSLKSTFHKQVWSLHKEIENSFKKNKQLSKETIVSEIVSQLEISFRILCQKQTEDLNYVMLTYFRILEILSEYYINKNNHGDHRMTYRTGEIVKYCRFNITNKNYTLEESYDKKEAYFSTSNKVMAIMCERLGFDLTRHLPDFKNVFRLSQKRNDFIHPKNRASYTKPDAEQIVQWTKTLTKILMKLS